MIPVRTNFNTIEAWADALCRYLTEQDIDGSAKSKLNPPIGAQVKWPNAAFTPPNWLKCDGAGYAVSRYPQLARVLATVGPTLTVPTAVGEIIRAE